MPWENKGGGGPWGGGGGGSGGSGGSGGGGPWGRGGGSGGGQRPPDIEEFIKKGQDRVRSFIPGGGGGLGRSAYIGIALVLVIIWLFTGVYRVQTNEEGVVLRFGQWVQTTQPGLNWHLPWPIESVETPSVTSVQQIDVGFRAAGSERARTARRDVEEESLMLTGDQNIIDIDFTVQWKIADAGQYLFNIRDPDATVKIAAESAMREIIGRTDIQPALTEARGTVEAEARSLLQATLNEYEAGIEITQLVLQDVQPPGAVIESFNDVLRAQQDRDRARNEADRYRNDILPRARGDALRVVQEAEAYKEQLENEAEGEAERFLSVFRAYQQNPDVTRRRMFLETLEGVLSNTDKVIMDGGSQGSGAIPYLPLNELRGRTGVVRGNGS